MLPVLHSHASLALEKDVRTLTTQLGQLGSWDAEFSEVQINAWLVHQAPKVFSRVLPKGVSEPRIVLQDGKALVAARFKDNHWDTVVSFELTVQLTEEANVVAMGVIKHHVREAQSCWTHRRSSANGI